ncbi:Suppressor protein stp22 of temperature-sensitive alpha-factor receptor and arginine permease [Rhizina undulata]
MTTHTNNTGPSPQVLQWLLRVISPQYVDPQRTYHDVATVLHSLPSLAPRTSVYTHEDGRSELLLHLFGTIPVAFRGSSYNIPVSIWIPHQYPKRAPMVFVTPSRDMLIRPGNHVDASGKCYHPYLANWINCSDRSNIVDLCDVLRGVFGREPPVYAKQAPPPPRPEILTPQPPPPLPPLPKELERPREASPATAVTPAIPPPLPPLPKELSGSSAVTASLPGAVNAGLQRYQPSPQQTQPPPIPPHPISQQQQQKPQFGNVHTLGGVPVYSKRPQPPPLPPAPHRAGVVGTGPSGAPTHPQPLPPTQLPPYQQQQTPPYNHPLSGSPLQDHQSSGFQTPAPNARSPVPASRSPPPPLPPQTRYPSGHPQQPQTRAMSFHAFPAPSHIPSGLNSSSTPVSLPFPPPQQQQPPSQPQRAKAVDIMSIEDSTPLISNSDAPTPPPPPPNPEKDRILQEISKSLQARAEATTTKIQLSLEQAAAQREALLRAEAAMERERNELRRIVEVCDKDTEILRERMGMAAEVIRDAGEREVPSVDSVVVATTVVHGQLYDLVTEDMAIEDTIYVLGKALDRERISLDVFLKHTRALAREQFLLRALVKKITSQIGIEDSSVR